MTPFLQTAGWALIHFVWQGAAIAAVLATALHLVARRSANARYIVACAGLVAMLAAPIATARVMWATPDSVPVVAATLDVPVVHISRAVTAGAASIATRPAHATM